MAKIILSAFADEYSHNLAEQIEALKAYGFTHLEPRFISGRNISTYTDEEARALRKALDDNGISVYSLGSPLGKISLDDDFAPHLGLTERVCKIANILGASRIRMFSFYLPEGKTREQCRPEVLERLSQMLDIADKYGITLCHENEARIYGENAEQCLDILNHFGGRLRAVFDMGNFVLDGCESYPHAYNLLKEYIDYFHIKDSLPEGAIVPPGLGKANIAEILRAHFTVGRDFVITLEPHLQLFNGVNALTNVRFDNPYKFENDKQAFTEAQERLIAMVEEIIG